MADEEGETIIGLTAKEIKKLARPEFAANPDKFYPTKTLKSLGFERTSCPKCKNNFWRHNKKKVTCGDSQCEQRYSFIGVGTGIGRDVKDKNGKVIKKGKKISYGEAWKSFERSLTSARVPCTKIDRYPVVARWRADVDYVAAGIFCFQPYCVTGELEPPANPLIQPQFCLRFNDLDNIGLTGRHYSGFIMQGIQVFNRPGKKKFWADECVEFNYRWLTEELGIDPDEITFIEDVWAGGGNLGPSIEYFVGGLELGNMVFMQFKTFPDGRREPLQVQVIDVGIGLERVPWLINGSATSYCDVFPAPLEYFLGKVNLKIDGKIWDAYGPLSCLLNVDEVEDIEKEWQWIAEKIGSDVKTVKTAIEPIRDVYVILDHTRSILMAVEDGSLPSNVGGAANVRNILRRVFSLMLRHEWWDKFGMDGFLEIFKLHKKDLAEVYGAFNDYPSFRAIIELEYERWKFTDEAQGEKLKKLLKKKKGVLELNDWIVCTTSWGLPVDTISEISKLPIPGNLYYAIHELQERTVKKEATVLYNTAHLKETNSLYYANHTEYEFQAKILEAFPNVTKNMAVNMLVLDQSHFYPTSGGQENDTGFLTINGKEYTVVDVTKVGPCVMHEISPALDIKGSLEDMRGVVVNGRVDEQRRSQLRNNHTATHIMYASCRKVLGPHVWQHGAKKDTEKAHLDITHYRSLTQDEEVAIQMEANRIVQRCRQITKGFMPKNIAEKAYGFHLYQGGVVPGNELRVVSIADTDTEACCGTHCDNTAEVGTIKLMRSTRISDGILRLYFVAGENALKKLNEETAILHQLTSGWGVTQQEIPKTAERFFDGYKKLSTKAAKQFLTILDLQMKVFLLSKEDNLLVFRTSEDNPTAFISNIPAMAPQLKEAGKGVVFVGESFLYGMLGDEKLFDAKALITPLLAKFNEEDEKKEEDKEKKSKKATLVLKNQVTIKPDKKNKKAKPIKVTGVTEMICFSLPGSTGKQGEVNRNADAVVQLLESKGFKVGVGGL